jgi:hypothetical protein
MTESQIVTAVMELVTSAEGVTNTSLSPDQVAEEVDTFRVRMIMEADKATVFRRPYMGMTQEISSLKVEKTSEKVSYVNIPRLVIKANGEPATLYIGGKDDKSPYRVVTGDIENAIHDHFVGSMAIVHYQEGRLTFRNVAPQYIKVVAVFEDPSKLELGGHYDPDTSEYPFPAGMIDILIGKTADSYIRTMYRIRPQPNVQADIPNAGSKNK